LRYAVHIGLQTFERLSDEVTIRWLATSCPDKRLDADYQDLVTRASEQFAAWSQASELDRLSQKHPFYFAHTESFYAGIECDRNGFPDDEHALQAWSALRLGVLVFHDIVPVSCSP